MPSNEIEDEDRDNMEQEPSTSRLDARDKSKTAHGAKKSLSNAEVMEELDLLRGTIASQQEVIDHLQKDGQRANIYISENEAQKALPTNYPGPPYLLDRSRYPSDIWTASVAACRTLSVLINGGGNISHDDPLLLSCKLLTGRCARLSAANLGGLQAAAHIEPRHAGKMADMYYAHLRTTELRDPSDKDGDLDEEKLIPNNIVFDTRIKNEIKDAIEQGEKSKAPHSNSGILEEAVEHTEVDRDLDVDVDNKISTTPPTLLALSPCIITRITTAGRDIHLVADLHLVADVAGDKRRAETHAWTGRCTLTK